MRILRYILFVFLLMTIHLDASLNETLPSWHWAYRMIDRFQSMGLIADLPEMNRP